MKTFRTTREAIAQIGRIDGPCSIKVGKSAIWVMDLTAAEWYERVFMAKYSRESSI